MVVPQPPIACSNQQVEGRTLLSVACNSNDALLFHVVYASKTRGHSGGMEVNQSGALPATNRDQKPPPDWHGMATPWSLLVLEGTA